MEDWINKVKSICPHVDKELIRLDLQATHSVEATINRIFDGLVTSFASTTQEISNDSIPSTSFLHSNSSTVIDLCKPTSSSLETTIYTSDKSHSFIESEIEEEENIPTNSKTTIEQMCVDLTENDDILSPPPFLSSSSNNRLSSSIDSRNPTNQKQHSLPLQPIRNTETNNLFNTLIDAENELSFDQISSQKHSNRNQNPHIVDLDVDIEKESLFLSDPLIQNDRETYSHTDDMNFIESSDSQISTEKTKPPFADLPNDNEKKETKEKKQEKTKRKRKKERDDNNTNHNKYSSPMNATRSQNQLPSLPTESQVLYFHSFI